MSKLVHSSRVELAVSCRRGVAEPSQELSAKDEEARYALEPAAPPPSVAGVTVPWSRRHIPRPSSKSKTRLGKKRKSPSVVPSSKVAVRVRPCAASSSLVSSIVIASVSLLLRPAGTISTTASASPQTGTDGLIVAGMALTAAVSGWDDDDTPTIRRLVSGALPLLRTMNRSSVVSQLSRKRSPSPEPIAVWSEVVSMVSPAPGAAADVVQALIGPRQELPAPAAATVK